MIIPGDLQTGDCLLYKPAGLKGWLIALKTWHPAVHCECYIGSGRVVAARPTRGVDAYAFRAEGLLAVYRPTLVTPPSRRYRPLLSLAWFLKAAKGQRYDWLGLLRFSRWGAQSHSLDKQFCSEFMTRFYRAGGLDPFNGADADEVAPFQFALSPLFDKVWPLL